MAKLVPGAQITLRELTGGANGSFWAGGDTMTVTRVEIPAAVDAGVFSKWKYHLMRPGDETPTVLTAASLFKRAGEAPSFDLLDVSSLQLFDFDARWEAERLERRYREYTPGPVTMRRKLLTGNLFQAAEWAEATKAGMAITYTDETGQRHRAIQVRSNAFGRQDIDVNRMPIRLHNPLMITNFVNRTMDWAHSLPHDARRHEKSLTVATSFKAALHDGDRRQSLVDQFFLAPYQFEGKGGIAFGVEKKEKARFVRMVRSAMDADKREWEVRHPEGEAYPLTLNAQAQRSSRDQEDTVVAFALPEGAHARAHFINVVIRAVGLQLYVRPAELKLAELAREAEAFFFQEVVDRLAPERQRLLDAQAQRRDRNRTLVGDSFDSAEGESVREPEVQEDEPSRETAAAATVLRPEARAA
jgi:hypothetical protein